ncbi:MAG TPA: alkaline phosphatase family protein [Phycisphaerae bacterium]|mgnify:CR=1 FL=1|nr:alkaline phosphatase family protein [Phycisphaerae bacterium]HRW54166.1 alkaline phosphatase family protein [Phycisphaerae bacterium]
MRVDAPLPDSVVIPQRCAVLFFVDGLDTDRLEAINAVGAAPAIRRHFIEGGLAFSHASACFPTVTYSNAVSLMTGRYPGRHGITANEWFDRSTLRYQDYATALTYLDVDSDFGCRTIYELLAPALTSSVQCAAARGASWRWQSQLANGFNWAAGDYEAVDTRVGRRIQSVIRRACRTNAWPVFQTYYFPGADKVAHERGVASARYAAAVENIDARIGEIIDSIELAAGPHRTDYWLVSDHGQMNCVNHHVIDIARRIHDVAGVRVVEAERRPATDDADVVLVAGRRHAMIHVRGAADWTTPPDAAAVQRVVDALCQDGAATPIHGVRCIYFRLNDAKIGIRDATGERVVTRESPCIRRVIATERSSFETELSALFESSRAGDIIVLADASHDFQHKDCGGHGGATPRERRIPLFLKGPGVPAGVQCDKPVRIIDVMPSILDRLGYADRLPPDLDGHSLNPLIP